MKKFKDTGTNYGSGKGFPKDSHRKQKKRKHALSHRKNG